ncbi:apolipoprotein C-IV [Cololabis saira]|uniref:apolipoprotein C-IV n=1 Tax=Cololabis saira TaxID=129043 RepID=UPI002AD2CD77|nr:apolipoprotein C-IV [Cololabis saira]
MLRFKALAIIFVLLMQACLPALTQTPAAGVPDSPGILRRLADRARHAKDTIQVVGGSVYGFAEAYYEDHIQPVTNRYTEWASNKRKSAWESVQTAVGNYMPSRNYTH